MKLHKFDELETQGEKYFNIFQVQFYEKKILKANYKMPSVLEFY